MGRVFANGPGDLGQSQVVSYERLLKWYLIPTCLTLSNIRYVSRVKWSNPGKEVAPSPTLWCSSYWKGSLLVALDYSRQLYLYIYIYIYEAVSESLPSISKTIQIRQIRHVGHCWRSKDELMRDVLLWMPSREQAWVGWPTKTYLQQLCMDTGCSLEDLSGAMNDKDDWQERFWEIHARYSKWWYSRHSWYNNYHHKKWTWRSKFKS